MFKLIARMLEVFAALSSVLKPFYIIIIFYGQIKLFSDLYLVKFLDISAKPFFPCITLCNSNHYLFLWYSKSLTVYENASIPLMFIFTNVD